MTLQWEHRGRHRIGRDAGVSPGGAARAEHGSDVRRLGGRTPRSERRSTAVGPVRPGSGAAMERTRIHHRQRTRGVPRRRERFNADRETPSRGPACPLTPRRRLQGTQQQRSGDGRPTRHPPRSRRARRARHSKQENRDFIHQTPVESVRELAWVHTGRSCGIALAYLFESSVAGPLGLSAALRRSQLDGIHAQQEAYVVPRIRPTVTSAFAPPTLIPLRY